MRTKEEILDAWLDKDHMHHNRKADYIDDYGVHSIVEDAMEEYAKEVAIDYAHYLLKKLFPVMTPDLPAADANALFEKYLTKKK
jgi:hypothetical protein